MRIGGQVSLSGERNDLDQVAKDRRILAVEFWVRQSVFQYAIGLDIWDVGRKGLQAAADLISLRVQIIPVTETEHRDMRIQGQRPPYRKAAVPLQSRSGTAIAF